MAIPRISRAISSELHSPLVRLQTRPRSVYPGDLMRDHANPRPLRMRNHLMRDSRANMRHQPAGAPLRLTTLMPMSRLPGVCPLRNSHKAAINQAKEKRNQVTQSTTWASRSIRKPVWYAAREVHMGKRSKASAISLEGKPASECAGRPWFFSALYPRSAWIQADRTTPVGHAFPCGYFCSVLSLLRTLFTPFHRLR